MAFDYTSGITFAKQSDLLSPPLMQDPLKLALRNANYLYRNHSPALLSVAYCTVGTLTRISYYHIPVLMGLDSLRYDFEHRFACSAATQTITVTVDYCTVYAGAGTAWTNLYAQNETTGAAGAVYRSITTGIAIPTTAVAIRTQYSAPAAGTRTDHHVLVYPNSQPISAGITASGFVPWDDGALTSAEGFALHEEHLNRVGKNAAYTLRDRKQCAFAWVQEYTATPHFVCSDTNNGQLGYELPAVRCYLPLANSTTLDVRAIATVSAGSQSDRLALGAVDGDIVSLSASGAIVSGTLDVTTQDEGLTAYVDLQAIPSNTAGNSTNVYALVAWYAPDIDPLDIVKWNDPAPIAASQLLAKACGNVQSAAVLPYAGTAHLFDGTTVFIDSRTIGVRVAPGAEAARYAVSETVTISTEATAFQYHDTTCNTMAGKTSRLFFNSSVGDAVYNIAAFAPIEPYNTINESTLSEPYSAVGFTVGDTALQLTTQNTPYTERVTVTYATGFAVCVSRQITDFETL